MLHKFQDMNPKARMLLKQYIDDLSSTCAEASWFHYSKHAKSERFRDGGCALAHMTCRLHELIMLLDQQGLWDDEM